MSEPATTPAPVRTRGVGPLTMDYLWVALGIALLCAIAVTLLRPSAPKFRFEEPAKSAPAAASATTPVPPQVEGTNAVPAVDVEATAASQSLQSLFADAQQEPRVQSLFVPADEGFSSNPPMMPAASATQPATPVNFSEIDAGRAYRELSKRDRRALDRVASLGGYGTPEQMATAFGYLSPAAMLDAWQRAEASGTPFRPVQDSIGPN